MMSLNFPKIEQKKFQKQEIQKQTQKKILRIEFSDFNKSQEKHKVGTLLFFPILVESQKWINQLLLRDLFVRTFPDFFRTFPYFSGL